MLGGLMNKGIYALELNEYFNPDSNSSYRRVPGGWIYGDRYGTCFIPFDNEFQRKATKPQIDPNNSTAAIWPPDEEEFDYRPYL